MKGKRTNIEFEKHELLITNKDGLLIHHLKKPDTVWENIKYINCGGVLSVTGDYGNWIFCREFHPSADGETSAGYWEEKLRICSTQEPEEFDSDATEKEINEYLEKDKNYQESENKDDLDPDDELTEEEREYLEECLNYLGCGEFDYIHYAHRNNVGRFEDHEYVPHKKKYKFWFLAVLDGFDEICRRIKNNEI